MRSGKTNRRPCHKQRHNLIQTSKLIRGWRPMGSLTFKVPGDNLFLMQFKHFWDKAQIQEGWPRIFEGNLFSVEDFEGLTPPIQMDVSTTAWMYNLPLA